MSRKQKIIVSITGIVLVSLILIGLTYAYFLTVITGNTNTKSISVTTANLSLTYSDNSDVITGDKILPGTTLTPKTFTVTNNGNKNIDSYKVGLVNVLNTFTRTGDIVYTLKCNSSVPNKICNGVTEAEFPNLNSYIVENEIDKDEVQTYTLTVTYKEMGVDQSDDMNKELSAKIDIFDSNSLSIQGNVINSSSNDYVVINSKEQISEIVNGKYKFIGIEPDNHTISIKNKTTTTVKNTTLNVEKNDVININDDSIIFSNDLNNGNMDLNISDTVLSKDIKSITPNYKMSLNDNNEPVEQGTPFTSLNGTYFIQNYEELLYLAYKVNSGTKYTGETFILISNINFEDYHNSLIPIGNSLENYFDGSIEGNGNRISNGIISSSNNFLGLFGVLGPNASIKNFDIDNFIVGDRDSFDEKKLSNSFIGFVGYNMGKIENVVLNNSYFYGNNNVGGLTGMNIGNITNCTIKNNSFYANNYVGGYAGFNSGNIESSGSSFNSFWVNDYVGYISGFNSGIIEDSSSSSDALNSVNGSNKGDIAGFNNGKIQNCSPEN